MAVRRTPARGMNFTEMRQVDVPQGRNGKHKGIVTKILSDLDQVGPGVAIRVPLADCRTARRRCAPPLIVPPATPAGSSPPPATRPTCISGTSDRQH